MVSSDCVEQITYFCYLSLDLYSSWFNLILNSVFHFPKDLVYVV